MDGTTAFVLGKILGGGGGGGVSPEEFKEFKEQTEDDIEDLNDRCDNLENIGRFLALWDATTGLPTTEPFSTPYEYKTGDYYRIGRYALVASTNYRPIGSSYTGTASTTEETETIDETSIYFYDGTQWVLQASGGGGSVNDVQVDGQSKLSGGIASFTSKTLTFIKDDGTTEELKFVLG